MNIAINYRYWTLTYPTLDLKLLISAAISPKNCDDNLTVLRDQWHFHCANAAQIINKLVNFCPAVCDDKSPTV